MKRYCTSLSLAAAAALTAITSVSHASTFTESTDAGDTLGTADSTISGTSPAGSTLTAIYGSLGNMGTDADLYIIDITSPSTFSATTNNALTNAGFATGETGPNAHVPLDTALFLFDSSGQAVETNDDTSGSIVTSTLPASTLVLSAGIYYVGISISGNEPVNPNNQLLFATNDDSTAIRGPEGSNNLNPLTLSTFDLDNYDDEVGNYEIDLTGATAAPEPSSWALAALGGLAVGYASLRRRRRAAQA
jgi:hypothetical protein